MKKISCNIIKDVLPLYLDDVVSEDTKNMVEEHLNPVNPAERRRYSLMKI